VIDLSCVAARRRDGSSVTRAVDAALQWNICTKLTEGELFIPPDVLGVGLRVYPGYWFSCIFFSFLFFFFFFFVSYSRSSSKTCHIRRSEPDLKMHVFWTPSPPKTDQNCLLLLVFQWLRDLISNIIVVENAIDNRGMGMETAKDCLQLPIILWSLVHKRLKIGLLYFKPSMNVAFSFASLHSRTSQNASHPNFGWCKGLIGIRRCCKNLESKDWGWKHHNVLEARLSLMIVTGSGQYRSWCSEAHKYFNF